MHPIFGSILHCRNADLDSIHRGGLPAGRADVRMCVTPTPSLTVTALPTATPTPTPVRGVDPNAAPATNRNAATTRARHLAERFDEGGVERAYFLDRYVIVTGIAVRADALRDWQW